MSKFDYDDLMVENNDAIRVLDIDEVRYNIYAVGDVHGCVDEMVIMIAKCKSHAVSQNKEAIIYFLGDLIDRGPSFIGVIEELVNNDNVHCILGNHELNFYLEAMGNKECRSKARRENHDRFQDYGETTQNMIMKTIGDMPNLVFINEKYILAHSPIRNIERTTGNLLSELNGPQCCMRNDPVDMNLMEEKFDGLLLVHGHQSWNYKPLLEQLDDQLHYSNKVYNLDSGCVYGDRLTAFCLTTEEVLEVEALRAYSTRH